MCISPINHLKLWVSQYLYKTGELQINSVGMLKSCFMSNDARIYLNVVDVAVGVSK